MLGDLLVPCSICLCIGDYVVLGWGGSAEDVLLIWGRAEWLCIHLMPEFFSLTSEEQPCIFSTCFM